MEHKETVVKRTVEDRRKYLVSFDGEVTIDVTGMVELTDEYKESVKEVVEYENCVRGQLVRKMMDNKVLISFGILDHKLSSNESKKKADWLLSTLNCHLTDGYGNGNTCYYLFMPKTEEDIKCMLVCLALAQNVREYSPGTNFDKPYSSRCGSSDIKCGGTYVVCTEEGSLVSCSWATVYDWNRRVAAVQSMADDMHTLFDEAMSNDNVESVDNPTWDDITTYRVKPDEPEYRPYKDIDEFIHEFRAKNDSFGEPLVIWIKDKSKDIMCMCDGFDRTDSVVRVEGEWWSLEELLEAYTYLDGAPLGVKE